MTDLTTLSAEELDAQIEALNAEKARREAEPDWEAWRPALLAWVAGHGQAGPTADPFDLTDKRRIRGLIAAAPLIPTPEIDVDRVAGIIREAVYIDRAWAPTSIGGIDDAALAVICLLGHAPKGGAA